MKLGMMFYRFGILGLLFGPGVFFEEPLKTDLAQHHSALTYALLLYCFPVLVGFTLIMMTEESFRGPDSRLSRLIKALSILTVCWFLLWWVIWSEMGTANSQDLFLRYMTYLNVGGLALGLACLFWALRAGSPGKSLARFILSAAWTITYTSAMNLHVQPTLKHFMGPGVGGLLVALGALLISRDLD